MSVGVFEGQQFAVRLFSNTSNQPDSERNQMFLHLFDMRYLKHNSCLSGLHLTFLRRSLQKGKRCFAQIEFHPDTVVLKPALEGIPVFLHIHDTFGMALLNVREALCRGFDRFDSATGGLGGCPYAPGAAGNAATEDLVFYLNGLGIETGLDPLSLVGVARRMREWGLDTLGHLVKSRFGQPSAAVC